MKNLLAVDAKRFFFTHRMSNAAISTEQVYISYLRHLAGETENTEIAEAIVVELAEIHLQDPVIAMRPFFVRDTDDPPDVAVASSFADLVRPFSREEFHHMMGAGVRAGCFDQYLQAMDPDLFLSRKIGEHSSR